MTTTCLLRQSWRSNYCAVYSTAMFLAVVKGAAGVSRNDAWRLFDLDRHHRRDYRGASLHQVRRVAVEQLRPEFMRWFSYSRFDADAVVARARKQLDHATTLLSFDAISQSAQRGQHVVVLRACTDRTFECLDPLGRHRNRSTNVKICRRTGNVDGAAYRVDIDALTWLLVWRRMPNA